MQSEFYKLRRTAIKDLSAYCGFLLGFLGSAPLAWELLAGQLDQGSFARGLWYFFGIVFGAGIFSGIAGLGIGFVVGLSWEQIHRYRRQLRSRRKAGPDLRASADAGSQIERQPAPAFIGGPASDPPRLHLISPSAPPFPELTGRRLASVRFLTRTIEMEFGGTVIGIPGNPVINAGARRYRYPDPGSRDALCSLIGARVERMKATAGDRTELRFDTGWELIIPRSSSAVA
jgi:hypothetical protein